MSTVRHLAEYLPGVSFELDPIDEFDEEVEQIELQVDYVVTPPDGTLHIVRMVREAPSIAPHIGSNGMPDEDAWTAAFPEPVYSDWGRPKIVVGGQDVTFFRNVPTIVDLWEFAEPFGAVLAVVTFPQIHSCEALPSWLGDPNNGDYRNIDIQHHKPDGSISATWRWEGLIIGHNDTVDGLQVECIGALFQSDFYLSRVRPVRYPPADIWVLIGLKLLTPAAREHRALRYKPIVFEGGGTSTGIEFKDQGHWQPEVTGRASEILAAAWLPDGSNQYTVRVDPGRRPVFHLKDITTQHYSIHLLEPGVTHDLQLDTTMEPTTIFGEGTDAELCRWMNMKFPYYSGGSLDDAHSAPIYTRSETEAYLYDENGRNIGRNPAFNPQKLRVERKVDYGTLISKAEATLSATLEVGRARPAGYFGEITLEVDPPEISRLEMMPGKNILVRGLRGGNRLMHIARVQVTFPDRVTLTVDEKARDAMTLAQILNRDRESSDPARRREVTRRNRSRQAEDVKVVWDCEAGAGTIPPTEIPIGAWAIIPFLAGQAGDVVKTTISLSSVREFAAGIFDRPISAGWLASIGNGNPIDFHDYWDVEAFGDPLLVAWGSFDEPGGYSPGRKSEEDALTGEIIDNAAWYFESTKPPSLWLAVYVPGTGGTTTVSGLLQQSNDFT